MNFSCSLFTEKHSKKRVFSNGMVIAHSRAELYFRDDIKIFDDLILFKNHVYKFIRTLACYCYAIISS